MNQTVEKRLDGASVGDWIRNNTNLLLMFALIIVGALTSDNFFSMGQITFALQLYNMPEAAQIYVVVHEYCHFLQPNHSPAFWAEVAKLMPDWKARRDLLKR